MIGKNGKLTIRERELISQIEFLQNELNNIDYTNDTMNNISHANSLKIKIYIIRKKLMFHRNGLPEHGNTPIPKSSKSFRNKINE